MGTGGFGLVYRGVLPVSQCPEKVRGKKPTQDLEVAVKVLDVDTTLSDQRFKSQMELLGRLKHKYLVSAVNHARLECDYVLSGEEWPWEVLFQSW